MKPQNFSTGPRTEQGKQRSSLNALRHGLTGQTVVLPSEDHRAYQSFCRGFFEEYNPETATERQLVQTVADCSWRLNRLRAQEQTLLSIETMGQEENIDTEDSRAATACASALAFEKICKLLSNLTLYEQRISRQFERALKMLKEIQAERESRHDHLMAQAAGLKIDHDASQSLELQTVPYNPFADGFVFSNARIDAWIDRDRRQQRAQHHLSRASSASSSGASGLTTVTR